MQNMKDAVCGVRGTEGGVDTTVLGELDVDSHLLWCESNSLLRLY